jgi:hypothetical protein
MAIARFSLASVSILADLAGQSGNLRDVFDLLNQWITGKMWVWGLDRLYAAVLRYERRESACPVWGLYAQVTRRAFIDTERLVTRKSRTAC